jgi:hypothetical protein
MKRLREKMKIPSWHLLVAGNSVIIPLLMKIGCITRKIGFDEDRLRSKETGENGL